ncbi:MAG: alanine racemase [Rhizobiaceae bacterium]|nr:alanine racemase [Rhizobiaceae bacterium]
MFENMETPRLILDRGRLIKNTQLFMRRSKELGVKLRPHLKTPKSDEVGKLAKDGDMTGITVSTLKEAEYFANNGFSDILLAAAITPNKFARVKRIFEASHQQIILATDSLWVANEAVSYAAANDCDLAFVIEVDCGEHRSGLPHDSAELIEIARVLSAGKRTRFKGVMTHGGHSYLASDRSEVAKVAETERHAVTDAAKRLADGGIDCEIVSVGSSPTVLWAEHLDGVTEVRAGVYLFWDLMQYGLNVCELNDIAMSVLATVIGHNRTAKTIVIDAGALAMSKDIGANPNLPDAKYGYVCDASTLERIGSLSIHSLYQEHGIIPVEDDAMFERLPIGSMVRILPNHSCLTASPYDGYTVIEDDKIIGEWSRMSGW